MAIGPGNKITTTGLIDKKPMIPAAPVMEAAQPVQQPTQAEVTPPVAQSQEGPLTTKYPGVKDVLSIIPVVVTLFLGPIAIILMPL